MQGKSLSIDYKQAIVAAKKYFDRCKKLGGEENTPSDLRTADALDIGVATVRRVMADYRKDSTVIEVENEIKRGRPAKILGEALQTTVRQFVRSANQNGEHVTLDILSDRIERATGQSINKRTLNRALDRWGFVFGKGKRSQHLKEKDHVVAARQSYLRDKLKNRRSNNLSRTEVYLDESYVNKNHSNDFIWYFDEDGPWVQKPTGKGERLIIINAITANGWVENAKLVFKSSRKTGDYHGQMNFELFSQWFKKQLLPNIPKNSLIIMDNASYHNTLSMCSAPTATCTKARIYEWLQSNKVPVSEDCLKAEMIEILRKLAPTPTYAIDEIANEHGHKILRTPPYHPELQPIETCWGIVKNDVARNCDFTMENLVKQLNKAFLKVTPKSCAGLIRKVYKKEEEYWKEDLKYDGELN